MMVEKKYGRLHFLLRSVALQGWAPCDFHPFSVKPAKQGHGTGDVIQQMRGKWRGDFQEKDLEWW